jgi:dimethylsulfone monooxygenase
MKFGLLLHPERGVDAVMTEARQADEQGFDSVWLFDHLMEWRGHHGPDGPYDSYTLMVAVGAVTKRTRLAWAMLNPSFRYPAVLAKMLSTLDQITHGRVICSIGAGWFKEEYEAYNIPLVDDHEQRIVQEREIVLLLKELWTHPAPEHVTFEGKYAQVRDLPFNPAPYQQPHPPIWIGGDSETTLDLVTELADGWVMLRSGNPETLSRVLSAPDWPKRKMDLVRSARVFVGASHEEALDLAAEAFEKIPAGGMGAAASLEEFAAREIVGTADECAERIREIESWGITCLRLTFESESHQEAAARLLLPMLER